VRLKRSTPGREKPFSLETCGDNYKTKSVQFRVHRALGVISERSFFLPTAIAAGIRMMSPLDAPRNPVLADRPASSAKVDGAMWSADQGGSVALVSSSCCTERGVLRLYVAPSILHPSRHHNTALSLSPAYQHSPTHQNNIQLKVPACPCHIPSLSFRPPSTSTRPPCGAASFLGLQHAPPASSPPSPMLHPRPMPKLLS